MEGRFYLGDTMALTRAEKIIHNARLTLADPDAQRWSDDILLSLLNEALIDFNQQTECLHRQVDIVLTVNNPYFDLPNDCWMLTRVLYNNSVLPIITHKELDELGTRHSYRSFNSYIGAAWETTTGSPLAIVYDRRNINKCKVYPIPDESVALQYNVSPDSYGVLVAADGYTMDSVYGVVSEVITDDTTEYFYNFDYNESSYGVVTNVADTQVLHIYYLKTPKELETAQDDIDTPSMYDIALKFYVCGQAFMHDIDTGSQQKGAIQMQVYQRHVMNAKKTSVRDFVRAGVFETTYRNGV